MSPVGVSTNIAYVPGPFGCDFAKSRHASTSWRATVALICIFISVRPATSSDTTARESGMGVWAYAVVAITNAPATITSFFMLSSQADLKVRLYDSGRPEGRLLRRPITGGPAARLRQGYGGSAVSLAEAESRPIRTNHKTQITNAP